jgi:AcrR family transcriptional regulator
MTSHKQEKYHAFAEATLKLIFHRGEEAVSHTQVARAAGVSRAWVYKYVGREKSEIVEFAIDYFGKAFSGLETPFEKMSRRNWREVLLKRTHDFLTRTHQNRWIIPLYYRYKGTDSVLGRRIDQIEEAYLKNLEQELKPVLGKSEQRRVQAITEVLTALRLGLAFRLSGYRPRLSAPIDELVEVIGRWMRDF